MTIHSSLSKGSASAHHRTVIKRYEKIQKLQEKKLWDETKSVFGLPKIKMIKIKAKKDKPKAEDDDQAQTPGAAQAVPAKKGSPAAKKD